MKKLIVWILLILLSFSFAGCGGKKKYRIGVSQCSQDDWRNKMNEEIYREIMLHPEAEVEIRSADDSNEKQIADIRFFKENDFDIIIVAPNEADAITPVVKEVYESGIPVIVFDRNINGDSYTATQGVDNIGIGKAAASYAMNLVGAPADILEIYGLPGSTPAIERHAGFMEEAEKLGLNVVATVYGNWNNDDASRVADSILSMCQDIDLIYAHNDRMAIAASEVARKKGLDIRIIGIDAAPEIGIKAVADGVIDATFLYPTDGYRLIRTALAILEGKSFERSVRLPLSSAVDKSNADILLMQNNELKEETSKIKALKSQVDDYWNRHSAQTTLFYAVLAILVLLFGILFMILRLFWQHRRHQAELLVRNRQLEEQRDTEKALNEQLKEATQSKLMFFTNVSHDLKTPLTLISEPVEQLVAADYLTPAHHRLMMIANKNVKILRRLINQILDFRKYENGKLRLNLAETRFGEMIREWTDSFEEVAHRRNIKLDVDISLDEGTTFAMDVEKIERVFFNIMSNAFKYTPDNGKIRFTCSSSDHELIFSIEDTGRGIASGDLGNIFDRFYQVDKIRPDGSGIGLSLAKAFVELHGGKIMVVSEPGKGSCFTVKIPVRHVGAPAVHDIVPAIEKKDVNVELGNIGSDRTSSDEDSLPLMLVIDDNEDMRTLIREVLHGSYRIIEASNGKDGVRLASKYVPDIIICDVMMPVMDGLECCRRIKSEITTSHIPVLMLTACSMDEQRIQGYESGADGYLSKPFDGRLLYIRCGNLIENRKRIKEILGISPLSDRKDSALTVDSRTDIDSDFYSRFLDIVDSEISNPDLGVDAIAERLGIGRSQFYRKIKSLTNYSPVELLRRLRMNKAREMLASTEKSISEIAYGVGFSAPAYFTKVYRETFGETPSELRERLGR